MKWIIALTTILLALQTANAEDIELTFENDELELHGTLSIPERNAPFPVVVMLHGSGANDRDQKFSVSGGNAQCLYPDLINKTIKNFKDIAEDLTAKGVAVFRYDKRTFTHGQTLDAKEITPYDFISDANAAIEFVKGRDEIDENIIILLGHSQGANFLPIIAQERNDISALLSLGTTATRIDTVLAYQFQQLYYKCAEDTAQGDAFYQQTLNNFNKIRNNEWDENSAYLGGYPKFWKDWMDITGNSISKIQGITTPTLFLQGEEDFNVPVKEAEKYENNLSRDSFEIFYLEGLNHYFTNSTDPKVPAVVVDTMYSWLKDIIFQDPNSVTENIEKEILEITYNKDNILVEINLNNTPEILRLYNVSGSLIDEIQPNSRNQFSIEYDKYNRGIYFLSIISGSQILTNKVYIR